MPIPDDYGIDEEECCEHGVPLDEECPECEPDEGAYDEDK
jgi:hypothetical protein